MLLFNGDCIDLILRFAKDNLRNERKCILFAVTIYKYKDKVNNGSFLMTLEPG